MKLYAQHGAMNGDKLERGLDEGVIDGVIFSPRDMPRERLIHNVGSCTKRKPRPDIFFDPQFYAYYLARESEARLGCLPDDYTEYFQPYRRSQLERDAGVADIIQATVEFQAGLSGLTAIVAPNILIPASFNSIEGVISRNFIRQTGAMYRKLKDARPVYATLAVSREALLDKQEMDEFLNEITILDDPPAGFYMLVCAGNAEARSDIYNADVIAAMMLVNYALRMNGFSVINGYSDILSPFLGAAGAFAGCTGWWSNLRTFSMDRFTPAQGGGRQPLPRYLSMGLLNRITFYELDQLRSTVPGILNDVDSDKYYPTDSGSEPQRADEILQSWDAIGTLNSRLVRTDVTQSLNNCLQAVKAASALYDGIQISLDRKSQRDHLEALEEGIRSFSRRAEVQISAD